MTTIVTRAGKGSPLTHNEVDANFTNLNTDKFEAGATFNAAVAATPAVTANTAKEMALIAEDEAEVEMLLMAAW